MYGISYRSFYDYNSDEWNRLLSMLTTPYKPWTEYARENRVIVVIRRNLAGKLNVTTVASDPKVHVWLTDPSELKPIVLKELVKP